MGTDTYNGKLYSVARDPKIKIIHLPQLYSRVKINRHQVYLCDPEGSQALHSGLVRIRMFFLKVS